LLLEITSPAVSRYWDWALGVLGHDLDLSGSRDVIDHVTIRLSKCLLPIWFFREYFGKYAPFSHNTYVTDDRQADRQTDATL